MRTIMLCQYPRAGILRSALTSSLLLSTSDKYLHVCKLCTCVQTMYMLITKRSSKETQPESVPTPVVSPLWLVLRLLGSSSYPHYTSKAGPDLIHLPVPPREGTYTLRPSLLAPFRLPPQLTTTPLILTKVLTCHDLVTKQVLIRSSAPPNQTQGKVKFPQPSHRNLPLLFTFYHNSQLIPS